MARRGAPPMCAFAPRRARAKRGPVALVSLVLLTILVGPLTLSRAGAQLAGTSVPPNTTSYYEKNANPTTLYLQGKAAGRAAAQGIVILDFGRPAYNGATYGSLGYNGKFVAFAAVTRGVENYIRAYYRYAPSDTALDVAIGTNNSCGPSQPCGDIAICGCPDEPENLAAWGAQLALTVEGVGSWASAERVKDHFTDNVRVVAADDAEPAFDPGYINTYAVLDGYASAVAGAWPAMVDYGSAEGSYWTEPELLQVAYGFRPDVPMPQVYFPAQVGEWAYLLTWAKQHRGKPVVIFGVLAGGAGTTTPQAAYQEMMTAIGGLTKQTSIPWLSTIRPLGPVTLTEIPPGNA